MAFIITKQLADVVVANKDRVALGYVDHIGIYLLGQAEFAAGSDKQAQTTSKADVQSQINQLRASKV